MRLDLDQWHVKLYFWCLDVWGAFSETYSDRHKSNLCQYIRTIFVWAPLAILANIAFWAYVAFVLFYYPLTQFGLFETTGGYLGLSLLVGAIILFIYLKDVARDALETPAPRTAEVEANDEEGAPGFVQVIWLYIIAAKEKVCPTIEFTAKQTQEVMQ